MTDVNLAASPSASALAAHLALEFPQAVSSAYRGVLTPAQLDVRETETAALLGNAAVHDMGWRRRIRLRGEDRFRWLSGMITNTVNDLPPRGGAWNLVLNAQGRIQGDLTVWRSGDELELEMDAGQSDRLLAHLEHFIIMDDVELAAAELAVQTAVGLAGPKAAAVLEKLGIPPLAEAMTQAAGQWDGADVTVRRDFGVVAEHYEIWIEAERAGALWQALVAAGARPAGWEAVEAVRVVEGIPAYGVDIAERDLPQETSQTRALHFNKGCYLGQEIVERIRSRGNVHRHLRSFELDGPLPATGVQLLMEGAAQPAGQITSLAELTTAVGTRRFALGMVKAEAELRKQPLSYTAGEATGTARLLDGGPVL